MEGCVLEIKIGKKTQFTGEWIETSLEDLKTVQPPVPFCIVPKFDNKCKFVGAIAVFYNTVQPYIKSIAKNELINANSCQYYDGLSGPVGQTGPDRLLKIKLSADIGLKLPIFSIFQQCRW